MRPSRVVPAPARARLLAGSAASRRGTVQSKLPRRIASSFSPPKQKSYELPIHPYIPANKLLPYEQGYYCRRTKKHSKRDLHFHSTTPDYQQHSHKRTEQRSDEDCQQCELP